MPSRRLTVLVYEPSEIDGRRLVARIQNSWAQLGEVRVVWLKSRFGWPVKDFRSDYYPLLPGTHDHFELFGFEAGDNNRVRWQEEFDSAIVSFDSSPARSGSNRLTEWLSRSEFSGPVVFTGAGGVTQNFRYNLSNSVYVPKSESSWVDTALEIVLDPQLTFHSPWHVNYFGRDPKTVLKNFYSERVSDHRSAKIRAWHSAYFGDDFKLARDLALDFDAPQVSSRSSGYGISELGRILIECDAPRLNKPNIIWIDCGTRDLDDDIVDDVVGHLLGAAQGNFSFKPFVIFLCNHDSIGPSIAKLDLVNAAIAYRDDVVRLPSYWAGKSFDQLMVSYTFLKDMIKNQFGGFENMSSVQYKSIWRVLLNFGRRAVVPLMLARSVARLCGKTDFPSLAQWLRPGSRQLLNTEFDNHLRRVFIELHKMGLVAEPSLFRTRI